MDKVVPVLSAIATAVYWTAALAWTAAYYITIPLHYPAYYMLRLVAVILSPAWFVLRGIGSALGLAAALLAKLKFLYIFLASAALIGTAAGCLLYGTSTFVFILLGVEPARDQQAALKAEHRRQQRLLRKLQQQQQRQPGRLSRLLGFGDAGNTAAHGGRNSHRGGGGGGDVPPSSLSAAGSNPSALVGTFLSRALNGLGFPPPSSSSRSALLWTGPPPSYHTTQDLSPPIGQSGAHMYHYHRQRSSKFNLDDVDVDDDDDSIRYGGGGGGGGVVDEQELSDLAANEQDEQSYRESAMEDWLSNSSSVVANTAFPGKQNPPGSSSKGKGKSKAKDAVDSRTTTQQQNRDIHVDPLQEHRELLDTQWKRIRSLDRASKQQHNIGGVGGGGSGNSGVVATRSASRRGMLLSQTIHEESSETESL